MTENLSEGIKTLTTILKHRGLVQKYLHILSQKLEIRAIAHDLSKLRIDEFSGFVAINKVAREHPYGSKEYKKSLKDNDVIDLHFSRNSHHPEYHEAQVADMGLFDIIEMVCDWKSASMTYGNTTLLEALEIQIKRFGLTKEQLYLIKLIIEEIEK